MKAMFWIVYTAILWTLLVLTWTVENGLLSRLDIITVIVIVDNICLAALVHIHYLSSRKRHETHNEKW